MDTRRIWVAENTCNVPLSLMPSSSTRLSSIPQDARSCAAVGAVALPISALRTAFRGPVAGAHTGDVRRDSEQEEDAMTSKLIGEDSEVRIW